ncbi:hypothetical protein [Methanolobus vulcani]|uniref:hypothetical protein n=1 Tax=Methanolobus vulcani TaxID=38026 RepID=UPI0012B7A0D8|nr:hypothetical protein [Methanolobus vulcani]
MSFTFMLFLLIESLNLNCSDLQDISYFYSAKSTALSLAFIAPCSQLCPKYGLFRKE